MYLVRLVNHAPQVIEQVPDRLHILLPSGMELEFLIEFFNALFFGFFFKINDIFLESFEECFCLLILILMPLNLPFPAPDPFFEVSNLLFLGSDILADLGQISCSGLLLDLAFQFLYLALQFLNLAPHRPDLGIELLGAFQVLDILLKLPLLLLELIFLSADVVFDDLGSADAVYEPENVKLVLIDLQNHPTLRGEERDLLSIPPLAERAILRRIRLHYRVTHTSEMAYILITKFYITGVIVCVQGIPEHTLVIARETFDPSQQTRLAHGIRRSDAVNPFLKFKRMNSCKSAYILQFEFHYITLCTSVPIKV